MRNKLLLFSLLTLLLPALRVDAATYTVKAGGGGSYATIQACASSAAAGDTCVVFAGTYNETVSINKSGSAGSPITFSVNPGDCVTVSGWNLGSSSFVVIGTPGTAVCTKGGVTFSGFEITGGDFAWTQIHNVTIQNNYFHNTQGDCVDGPHNMSNGASTFVYVLNNTMTACGGGGLQGGISVEGNHWLIEGNTISHVADGVYLYGAYMVVRNNHFGPINQAEQGSNHPDAIESSCSAGSDYPLQHMVFEGNTIQDWLDSDGHGLLLRDTQSCGQTSNVMRFNQFINVGSYWTSNETNSFNEYWYNNSSSGAGVDLSEFSNLTFSQNDTGAQVMNNSFANDWAKTAPFCIYEDGTSVAGFAEHNNACFKSGFSGTWQNGSIGAYSSSDIFNKDPHYVSATDLHLQSGSPLIAAGGPLTTATGNGSTSTSLTVANAGFFSDGYGLTGVQGDWIRIGASTTVQIVSVNYSSNVLTLASPVSWSSGASVYLSKNSKGVNVLTGANPDIGALPFGSSSSGSQPPLPPTNIQAVAK